MLRFFRSISHVSKNCAVRAYNLVENMLNARVDWPVTLKTTTSIQNYQKMIHNLTRSKKLN